MRRRDAGESDRRLTLLTEELGVFDAVARGARKGASRLAGASEPLSVNVFQLAAGKRLSYVTQAQPVTSFPGLRADYERLTLALAIAELAETVLPHEQPAPEAFRFLLEALRYIEIHEKPLVAAIWAELKLLEIAGFAPHLGTCVVSGAAIREAEPFVSPTAGGYVCLQESLAYADRFKTRAEVLYGLDRTAALDLPPQNLKLAQEAYAVLLRLWEHIAERPLPARESAAKALADTKLNGTAVG